MLLLVLGGRCGVSPQRFSLKKQASEMPESGKHGSDKTAPTLPTFLGNPFGIPTSPTLRRRVLYLKVQFKNCIRRRGNHALTESATFQAARKSVLTRDQLEFESVLCNRGSQNAAIAYHSDSPLSSLLPVRSLFVVREWIQIWSDVVQCRLTVTCFENSRQRCYSHAYPDKPIGDRS